MKSNYLMLATFAMIISSCAMTTTMTDSGGYPQDDIYYIPNRHNFYTLSRVEKTPDAYSSNTSENTYNQSENTQSIDSDGNIYYNSNSRTKTYYGNDNTYYIKGYWLNDFIGSDNDLEEAYNMIARYPQGFSVAAAGSINAIMDISFDSDWNVFTDGDRYWWFPSNQNFDYYSKFMFGNYENYIYAPFIYSPYMGVRYDHFYRNSRISRGFSINFGMVDPWYLNNLSMNGYWGYGNYYNGYYGNYYNPYYDNYYYGNWGRWNYGRPYHYGYRRYYPYYENRYIRHYGGSTTWYKPYRIDNNKRDPYGQRPNTGNSVSRNTQRYNNGRVVNQNGTTVQRSSTGRVIRPTTSTTVRKQTRRNTVRSTTTSRSTNTRNNNSSVKKSSTGRIVRPTSSTTVRRPTRSTTTSTRNNSTSVRRSTQSSSNKNTRTTRSRVVRPVTKSSNRSNKSSTVKRNTSRVVKTPTRTVRRSTYTPTKSTSTSSRSSYSRSTYTPTRSTTTKTVQRTINRSNNSGGGRIKRR